MEDKENRGNWKATFHTSGASAFLHLKDPKDKKTLNLVQDKLEGLQENYKKLFRVMNWEELDRIGADHNAVLALALFMQTVVGLGIKIAAEAKEQFLVRYLLPNQNP
ncbi:hypothetical protein [Pricia sp.]|uniref:hypothetical protein n=1 Tax=Pricia sp. TaxID=2268138 RepID=UPI003593E37C